MIELCQANLLHRNNAKLQYSTVQNHVWKKISCILIIHIIIRKQIEEFIAGIFSWTFLIKSFFSKLSDWQLKRNVVEIKNNHLPISVNGRGNLGNPLWKSELLQKASICPAVSFLLLNSHPLGRMIDSNFLSWPWPLTSVSPISVKSTTFLKNMKVWNHDRVDCEFLKRGGGLSRAREQFSPLLRSTRNNYTDITSKDHRSPHLNENIRKSKMF